MKKLVFSMVLVSAIVAGAFAGGRAENRPLIFVWYPNESGDDLRGARDAISTVIQQAVGREVRHKLTTDYTIAIEAIANDKADLGFFGAQGYIEANERNSKVKPLVVNSGASGTLRDAMYYSWLAVRLGEEDRYRSGSGFSIENIQGRRLSWVSPSSTSGFVVPSASIVSHFSKRPQWAALNAEMLLEGGVGKFFSEVLFGQSHQGSAFNLLSGRADIAAICDTCVDNYVEIASGTANRPGAVYQVRRDAAAPFIGMAGQRFVIIQSIPVLNAPFVINTGTISAADQEKIRAALTSDATAQNQFIFVPRGATHRGLFRGGQRFLVIDDAWFQPIRDLKS